MSHLTYLLGTTTTETATEFNITGTSAYITLLVSTTGGTSVSRAIFTSLANITGTSSSSWAGTYSFGSGGTLESGGNNLRRQVQVATQELNTFVGQVPVVMSPGELFLNQATGVEGLHCFDDMQVRNALELGVLRSMGIFFGYDNTLFEEVFVNSDTMSLWHKHL